MLVFSGRILALFYACLLGLKIWQIVREAKKPEKEYAYCYYGSFIIAFVAVYSCGL